MVDARTAAMVWPRPRPLLNASHPMSSCRTSREEREKRERQELEEKNKLAAARRAELMAQLKALEEGVDDAASKVGK